MRTRDQRRHEEVLDTAIELIRTKGIDGTSFQDIANAVGIKKGSLVNYFSSKAELLDLVQLRFTEVAESILASVVDRTDLEPHERLRELLYLHAEHCAVRLSSPVLVSFMQLWAPVGTDDGGRQYKIRHGYERVFRAELEACIRAGAFRDVDVVATVHGLTGMMSWTAFWYDPDVHGPLRPVVDALIDMCYRGLAVDADELS